MAQWNKESLQAALESKGWPPERVDIQGGVQFRLQRSTIIDLYHTGRTVVGGPVTSFKFEVEAFVNAGPPDDGVEDGARYDQESGDASERADAGSPTTAGETGPLAANFPELHVDIQVHIDPAASTEQIEQIFASMARHLYGRGT